MTAPMSGRVAVDVSLGKGTEAATRSTRRCEWWQGCDDTAAVKGLCYRHYHRCWGASRRTSRRARFSSVFGDVDEAVVLRLLDGDRPTYTTFERREAVRRLRAGGLSYRVIAERLSINTRLVHRDLRALGLVGLSAGFPVEQEAG